MSSALTIASVTSVLKSLIGNGLIARSVASSIGEVTVSAMPPDRLPTGNEERNRLNIMLYRITPNSGWRNSSALFRDGPSKIAPLGLDLHYLISAHGEEDMHAEILLGHAIQLLHETPTLTPDTVRSALTPVSGGKGVIPATFATLSASTLADQLEEIKITPEFLSQDDLSRIWSSLQAHARPCMAYQVSVVLIHDHT